MIKLVKLGIFSALLDFSVPAKSAALWAAFVIGVVVQIVLDRNDPTVLFVYGILVCMLVGLAIPAIIMWVKNKKGGSKQGSDDERKTSAD